ncbi:hypothetical protein [Brochothrix thermosphacta]|uniref:hypothetical protein n=1 Tax=Brochothrix thermosphacta TaxID=2756 RepID=UPI003F9487A6
MKNKYLNQVDRLLRIIYKEIDFTDLLIQEDYSSGLSSTAYNLDNKNFVNAVKNKYLEIYPNNYQHEEIDIILDFFKDKLLKEYNATNCLYLIIFISKKILRVENNKLFVEFNDLLEWDGLINKLDANIFISAFTAYQKNRYNETTIKNDGLIIRHNNHKLYSILDRGISENHMHLKASGYITEMNWYYFKKVSIFNEEGLRNFIQAQGVFPELAIAKKSIERKIVWLQKLKFISILLESATAIDEVDKEKAHFSRARISEILLADEITTLLLATDYVAFMDSKGESYEKKSDDVTKYFVWEREFSEKLFTMLITGKLTSYTMFLFNCYLAGMNSVKAQFHQDNLGMGFSKFKGKEDNKEFFVPEKKELDIYRSVFDKYYREGNVKKIEFRMGPKNTASGYNKLIEKLDSLNEEYYGKYLKFKNVTKIKIGVIVHYIKLPHLKESGFPCSRNEVLRNKIDVDSRPLFDFFDRQTMNRKSLNLLSDNEILNEDDPTRIVAIDAANYEWKVRPEIFGVLFRKHQQLISEQHHLKMTFHVGEEFNTLSDGLRAIDETVEFLNLKRNHRLGHALALGIDVTAYFEKKRNIITTTLQDYIDDLVWMYSMIENKTTDETMLLLFLEREYNKYISKIVIGTAVKSSSFTLRDYISAYRLRGDKPELYLDLSVYDTDANKFYYHKKKSLDSYEMNFQSLEHETDFLREDARKLYHNYHYNDEFKNKGKEKVFIEVNSIFIQCVILAKEILRAKIINKMIFIEANPTSNKKISSVSKYAELPFLDMNSYHLKDSANNLEISINTDDSAIFQTNLSHEYSIVASALIREGYSEENVHAYMEMLQKNSLVHSFIKS